MCYSHLSKYLLRELTISLSQNLAEVFMTAEPYAPSKLTSHIGKQVREVIKPAVGTMGENATHNLKGVPQQMRATLNSSS
ncbi:hypothetical protein ACE6H2_022827 [Prunus campanulata]